jgi:hypothetical protein
MRVGTTWLINEFFLNPPHIKCRDELWWVGISNKKRKGGKGDIPSSSSCGGSALVIKKDGGDIPSSSSLWHTIICGWGLVIK